MGTPRSVDDEGMTPSIMQARTSATDGEWMDVASASMYAGVTRAVLTAALRADELRSTVDYSNVPTALVHSHAVEAWAAEREFQARRARQLS
jgi:hypothetical protein